jgi:predicted Zn-dependent protease
VFRTLIIAVLRKAVQLAPDIESIRLHYIQALIQSGKKKNARELLTKLLSYGRDFGEKADAKALLKSI